MDCMLHNRYYLKTEKRQGRDKIQYLEKNKEDGGKGDKERVTKYLTNESRIMSVHYISE